MVAATEKRKAMQVEDFGPDRLLLLTLRIFFSDLLRQLCRLSINYVLIWRLVDVFLGKTEIYERVAHHRSLGVEMTRSGCADFSFPSSFYVQRHAKYVAQTRSQFCPPGLALLKVAILVPPASSGSWIGRECKALYFAPAELQDHEHACK